MSTLATTEPTTLPAGWSTSLASVPGVPGDFATVFRGVDWHAYHSLSEAMGEGQHVRLAYDGKDLEMMVTGNVHEYLKELISKIVNAVTSGLDIDCVSCGETTWKTAMRGLQADLSCYFNPAKIQSARSALARKSTDPSDYPRPDLAIEIDMSPSQVDRAIIYSDLGVSEVWRFIRGETLVIEHLQEDRSYASAPESQFLHIRVEDVLRRLNDAVTERESAWNRRLNEWAMGLGRQAPQ